jgi:hypothetical protein
MNNMEKEEKKNKQGTHALTSVIGNKICPKSKRSQTTLFVIIALVVVALALVIYFFYPEIKSGLGFEEENPSDFIDLCVRDDIAGAVEALSLRGGSLRPEHYIVYNGQNIDYLCYTNEYYKTCVVQQPMLKQHIEREIEGSLDSKARRCFEELRENYEKQGYSVNLKRGSVNVELLPKRIVTYLNYSLTLTKEGSETYETFSVVLHNNLYELVSIANSIIEWEARYGNAETTLYMTYYKDLKVEKKPQTDGTTIYILTDRNTENKFQFASRSVAWPPGYEI